jgi:exopolyphosphatase/pppGpp-phosphohydrolase
VFLNLPFYNPKKIEGYEMYSEDVNTTIKYLENVNDNELQKHPCIGDRYMLLKNGIKILKIIMDKFPISKIIVTQKGLRDAITEEIILDYEKNKSS